MNLYNSLAEKLGRGLLPTLPDMPIFPEVPQMVLRPVGPHGPLAAPVAGAINVTFNVEATIREEADIERLTEKLARMVEEEFGR